MSSLPINPVDLIVIAVLLLSALLALFRGFVKEVLGIAGWVAAVAATIFFFPIVRDIVRSYIDSRLIADIVTGAAIFLPTLILCSLLTHWISEQVRASAVSAVDRSLGFLFGLARGALIVMVAWWVADRLMPPPTQPAWLLEARTRPLAELGYTWGTDLILRQLDPGRVPAKQAAPAAQAMPAPSYQMPAAGTDSRPQNGYKTEERRGIESLIHDQDKP
ncbi:CvpA family protein [Ferrovibrio xuzhouensis]|uniref:CvpA family protein n=1 Tax=Ferrovibrio xuzhouensis TaxID=1576914 RepID=A0ABV7VM01_9PROT